MYRTSDGGLAALSDRCPHRAAPLHLGTLQSDVVACGYHGLRFDRNGVCVLNPHGTGSIPRGAKVRCFPVQQRHGAIWIWPGDARCAHPDLIPDYSFLVTAVPNARFTGYLHVGCHYELAVANIMDLSHADFMHVGTLDTKGALARTPATVREEGAAILAQWWLPGTVAMGVLAPHLSDPSSPVDQWLEVCWQPPGLMLLKAGLTVAGQPRCEGLEALNVHLMTPETATSTHYFFGSARNFDVDNQTLNEGIRRGVTAAFSLQDSPMLEAQQREFDMNATASQKPVYLQSDAGGLRVRRRMEQLILAEQASA